MELDHLFFFVDDPVREAARLAQLGWVETYRRQHSGQGTENVCYAFDNLFVELLWVNDVEAVRSEPIRRTRLFERSQWQRLGTCCFGLAQLDCWHFAPPYLPAGLSLPVAVASDDAHQPMLFGSPGTQGPSAWPEARRGTLQHSAGLGVVHRVTLEVPLAVKPSEALVKLAARLPLELAASTGDWAVRLDVRGVAPGAPEHSFTLPL
jgi:Glyoxalase-like domain